MSKENYQGQRIGRRELRMAARAMIEMFGNDAPKKAIQRVQEYKQKGEPEGREFWARIKEVIQETLDPR